ncbi:hypothetical protein RHSIM_Rhsim03G0223000 [Rhododendron simsii]|uniref:Uncharacterized protein n=1 Tax=Rhododendron simsii TaxID=118357 RepID=A0A834HBE1_RHOSS|nr:hypothetical protein RHSIM_Rhsim03G0223000 [Rhododendron simsii]
MLPFYASPFVYSNHPHYKTTIVPPVDTQLFLPHHPPTTRHEGVPEMGRSPCCDETGLKKGPWTPEEDQKLTDYIHRNGHGSWRALPKLAGLNRCGKSCRLRWTNYLRPDIKRGKFTEEEEQIIINLHQVLGNKWSAIATHLPGRTDNEIKNFWNTHLRKKLLQMGIDPVTHRPRTDHLNLLANLPQLLAATNFMSNPMNSTPWDNNPLGLQTDAAQLAKFQLLNNILQVLSTSPSPPPVPMEALNLMGSQPLPTNQQLYEYLRGVNPVNLSQNIPSTFPNLDFHQPNIDHHIVRPDIVGNSKAFENVDSNGNFNQLSAFQTENNSLPALVSDLPEFSTVKKMENRYNQNNIDMSNPSSTSTTFEAWGDLMDDEAVGDSYNWRDIIDQATSPSWPIS